MNLFYANSFVISILSKYYYLIFNNLLIKLVGTRTQICILGLKPYLIMWIRLRRSKRLDRPQNGGSHTKKGGGIQFEEVIFFG